MKKVILLISAVLISVVTVSAQAGRKAEKRISPAGRKVVRLINGIVRVGPSTTYLKNGLSTDEVVRLLGQPTSASERLEGDIRLATYTFPRGEGRVVVAEFENGVLVSSRTELGENLVRN